MCALQWLLSACGTYCHVISLSRKIEMHVPFDWCMLWSFCYLVICSLSPSPLQQHYPCFRSLVLRLSAANCSRSPLRYGHLSSLALLCPPSSVIDPFNSWYLLFHGSQDYSSCCSAWLMLHVWKPTSASFVLWLVLCSSSIMTVGMYVM